MNIKEELTKLGIGPKKGLGQNFLINEGVYDKLVSAAEVKPGDTVIEVGSGLGTLTKYLADAGADIVAIEKDRNFAGLLQEKFKNHKNVKIIEGDILKFDPAAHGARPATYKIVGNIPYYLTSRLLRVAFETWPQAEVIVFMLQKEVAERIVAKPPTMSLLAVSVQYYAEAKIVSRVGRNSFWPAPDVDSAIIKMAPTRQPNPVKDKKFFRIVVAGFAGKRKQLANTLSSGLKLSKQNIQSALLSIGIDPKRRPETLTLTEWHKITEILA